MTFLSRHPFGAYLPSSRSTKAGGLLLEAILAIALFSIFLSAIGLALVTGERSTTAGGDRSRATFLAEQSLEGIRALREEDFDVLSVGTFGVRMNQNGWQLLPSPVITDDGFTTAIQLTERTPSLFEAVASVQWNFGAASSGSVMLSTYLTDWRKEVDIGNWASLTQATRINAPASTAFRTLEINGTTAFVGADSAPGANGLFLYSIANPAAPVRIASSFSLPYDVLSMASDGTTLFVITNDDSAELKVYDIASPSTLSATNLSGSYDIPGNSAANTIAIYGSTVYLGLDDNPTGLEFYTVGYDEDFTFTELDSLEIGGSVHEISLQDGFAYVATTADSAEFQVIDVFDPTELVFAPGIGMDLPDVYDAPITAAFGTSAIIGRLAGTAIDELIVYSIADSPLPSPPPGPWTTDVGADVRDFSYDPSGLYGFVASTRSNAQLRVYSIPRFSGGQAPLLTTYNLGANPWSIEYDWQTDRLFLVTDSTLRVFSPG